MNKKYIRLAARVNIITFLAMIVATASAQAGVWGSEKWGQMYWGDNSTSAPIVAPRVVSTVVDGDTITFEIEGYTPGDDGWSVVEYYSVSCGEGISANASDQTLVVRNVEGDTDYTCEITATNAFGESTPTVQQVTVEALRTGLPVWLLYEATRS